jgi:hypothetical protein
VFGSGRIVGRGEISRLPPERRGLGGRAQPEGALSRVAQQRDRPCGVAGCNTMGRDKARAELFRVSLEAISEPGVEVAPATRQQAGIGGVVDEGVGEPPPTASVRQDQRTRGEVLEGVRLE